MKSIFISLLEGFLWVVVVAMVIVCAMVAAKGGFWMPRGGLGAAMGAFVGMCAAAVLCGPAFLLLSMNEKLEKIATKS